MFNYDEIFYSIQGESSDSGLPCVFVRLYGCPVGCVYCDQIQDPKNKKRASIKSIVDQVRAFKKAKYVCITGGEPLIYEDTLPLVMELKYLGYKVSIETSGCVPIEYSPYTRTFKYVMDVKCPSSGVSEKNLYDNLLKLQQIDEVKYVIADRKDYEFMKSIMQKYPTSAKVLVSPLFNKSNKQTIGNELTNWILEDGIDVRVQIQLHKILGVL